MSLWGITDPEELKSLGYVVSSDSMGPARLILGGFDRLPGQAVLPGLAAYLTREALACCGNRHCAGVEPVCNLVATGTCLQVFCCCQVIADSLVGIQKRLFYQNTRLTFAHQRDLTKTGSIEISLTDLFSGKALYGIQFAAGSLFPALQQLQNVLGNLQFTGASLDSYIRSLDSSNFEFDSGVSVYSISKVGTLLPCDLGKLTFDLYHNTTGETITAYTNALIKAAEALGTVFGYAKFVISPYTLTWNGVVIVASHEPWETTLKKFKCAMIENNDREFLGSVIWLDFKPIIAANSNINSVLQCICNSNPMPIHGFDNEVDHTHKSYNVNTDGSANTLGPREDSPVECLAVLNVISSQMYRNPDYLDETIVDFWEYCDAAAPGSVVSMSFANDSIPYTGFRDSESSAWVSFSGLNLEVDTSPWHGVLLIQCRGSDVQTLQASLNRAEYKGQTIYATRVICPPELIGQSLETYADKDYF